jgi:beta-phosphoglucomutase-like phosphatase (HAD superfamily)
VQLPVPDGDYQAYLFDCDGTITDSMPAHYLAWQETLAAWGCDFPEDLFYAWGGRPVADIVAELNSRQGLDMPVHEVAFRQEELFRSGLAGIKGVPGVLEHIADAFGRLPIGVVSGSTRLAVTASLEALDLLDRFPVLVCAGDYVRPKPFPDAYLLGASLLGVPPEKCLAFEDTELGMNAAVAAGMTAVQVPPPWERA